MSCLWNFLLEIEMNIFVLLHNMQKIEKYIKKKTRMIWSKRDPIDGAEGV